MRWFFRASVNTSSATKSHQTVPQLSQKLKQSFESKGHQEELFPSCPAPSLHLGFFNIYIYILYIYTLIYIDKLHMLPAGNKKISQWHIISLVLSPIKTGGRVETLNTDFNNLYSSVTSCFAWREKYIHLKCNKKNKKKNHSHLHSANSKPFFISN